MWPPSSVTSTGFLLPTFDSRHWCWPSRPSMELHLSTSKHCSDQTPQLEHFALLHQLAGWYRHRWEQTKPSRQSRNSSLFWHLMGGANSRPMSGQQNSLTIFRKILKTHLFRSSMTPSPNPIDGDLLRFLSCDKHTFCKSLWSKASAKCPKCKRTDSQIHWWNITNYSYGVMAISFRGNIFRMTHFRERVPPIRTDGSHSWWKQAHETWLTCSVRMH